MNAPVHYDPSSDAWTRKLEEFDVSDPALYQNDTWYPWFERLRREAPVHYCRDSLYGPYWSVSKYKDVMTRGLALRIHLTADSPLARLGADRLQPVACEIRPGRIFWKNSVRAGKVLRTPGPGMPRCTIFTIC